MQPGVWLLNPGRGGPAGVEEQWVSVENGGQRLGVPPAHVTDYLALVGDSSDNVPGVHGIGDKTARELVMQFGDLENILSAASTISKKRPREALLAHADLARLSKTLVTIRRDLPMALSLDQMRIKAPDTARLRQLFVELEFQHLRASHSRMRTTRPGRHRCSASIAESAPLEDVLRPTAHYETIDTTEQLAHLVSRARNAPYVAIGLESTPEPDSPNASDPLRATDNR